MPSLSPIAISVPGLGAVDPAQANDAARELEGLGFGTLWGPGGQDDPLPLDRRLLEATERIRIANGIISVATVTPSALSEFYRTIEADFPGRFLVGIGGAHSAQPRSQMATYLDGLTGIPQDAMILAALGPRMLELARDRAGGAFPYLVTPAYVLEARAIVGSDRVLAVLVNVIPEAELRGTREVVGKTLGFFGGNPGYRANFLRMGFTEDDVDQVSDRLIDGLTIWGHNQRMAAGVAAYLDAGADQVVLSVNRRDGAALPHEEWRRLAGLLL